MGKSIWLASAGLMALTAAPALAQSAAPAPAGSDAATANTQDGAAQGTGGRVDPTTQNSPTAQSGAVANNDTAQQPVDTGDIVVTATRRNEALSNVPLAVSAVTAETLRNSGATDIRQLTQVSPSLLVSSTSSEAGAGTARIRGIGTVGDNPGLESSVGVFIDGVYRSRAGVGLTELGPVDRIEVLRGPQGTLFGRNTSAGLISVITAKPRFTPEASGALTIGNYNLRRGEFSLTGPLSDVLAARFDGVYMKRDGFLHDVISGRDVNDRDRYLLRGQLLFQPNSDLSVRIIADYTKRKEECCAAPFLPARDTVGASGSTATTEQPSTIAAIERGVGAIIPDNTYARQVAISPGQSYRSDVKDTGVSGEINYKLGDVQLTSITAYRYNNYLRGQDADFNNLDILHRAPDGNSFNRFKNFSEEVRFQGSLGKLDWLVGGYYSNEKLTVRDNLQYGSDYGRYANCLIALNFQQNTGAPLVDPTNQTCFNPNIATAVRSALTAQYVAAAGNAAAQAAIQSNAFALSAFARLPSGTLAPVNFNAAPFTNVGFTNGALALAPGGGIQPLSGVGALDQFNQTSNNYSLFTHNIFSVTDRLKLTIGLRYTHERKTLDARLTDNNTLCSTINLAAAGLQNLPCVIPSVAGGLLAGSSRRTENKLSGTGVISFKVTDQLLTYASYSRGYKAGGFNLDRSALSRPFAVSTTGPAAGPVCTSTSVVGCGGATGAPIASFDNLQFKPETNDAVELGAKYNGHGIDLNIAVFHQLFRDFQLNTFNGIQFIVENVNSCSASLNGTDTDNDPYTRTGACTGKTRPGVRSQGVEVELFTRPVRNLTFNLGGTFTDTKYRKDLVGANGRALPFVLFQLPGRRLSNSSEFTATSAVSFTPPIGSSGLHALFYIDGRYTSSYNTGSDLDLEKNQRGYALANARIGLRGPQDRWAIELFAQNLFNQNYKQVAFDAFAQGSCTARGAGQGYCLPAPSTAYRATQLYGAFLGEPRTYGLTLRAKFSPTRAPTPDYVAPVAPAPPPPPPPATITCSDGSVIDASATCPLQPTPPPPPAPPAAGERG